MTRIWCRGCRCFFDRRLHACPDCGTERHRPNEALVSSRWTSALNAQAEHAVKHELA